MSKPVHLNFEPSYPTYSKMTYGPAGKVARVSVFPSYETNFPDVTGIEIPIRDGKKAPPRLIGDCWVAWLEVEGKKRAFFALSASGEFCVADDYDPESGSQYIIVMTDPAGKVEEVRALPADDDPGALMRRAARLHVFAKRAAPIQSATTKIHSVDAFRMEHKFTATIDAPGINFVHTGTVADIRNNGLNPEGFKYFKKAWLWPFDHGAAVIALNAFGKYQIAVYDSTGKQQATAAAETFNVALHLAQNQIEAL
jgi:hypothetical protein